MSQRFLLAGCVVWWGLWGTGQLAAQPPQQEAGGYDAKGKRDPFVPLVRDGLFVGEMSNRPISTSTETPVLAGILWDPAGQSIALINESEVKVGQMVGDYQVAEIRPDAVVLRRDGESLVLQITFEEQSKPGEKRESRGGERR